MLSFGLLSFLNNSSFQQRKLEFLYSHIKFGELYSWKESVFIPSAHTFFMKITFEMPSIIMRFKGLIFTCIVNVPITDECGYVITCIIILILVITLVSLFAYLLLILSSRSWFCCYWNSSVLVLETIINWALWSHHNCFLWVTFISFFFISVGSPCNNISYVPKINIEI